VAAADTDPAYCNVDSKATFVLQLPSSTWTGQYFETCQQAFAQNAVIG
jgi:hypothetical protein